jgi:integrase
MLQGVHALLHPFTVERWMVVMTRPGSTLGRSTTSRPSCTGPSRTRSGGDACPATPATPPTRRGADRSPTRSRPGTPLRTFLAMSAESGDRLHPLWVLLATTGMRRGEALGLRWSDVDLDAGRLRIVQTIITVRSKVTVSEPRAARGRRPAALGPVNSGRVVRPPQAEARGAPPGGEEFTDGGLVFHRPDGSCLRPVRSTFKRRVAAAGLPSLGLKGLRHTWATLALERGIHPRVVQEGLGHSTIAITLGIYSHVAPHPPRRGRRDHRRPGAVNESCGTGSPMPHDPAIRRTGSDAR